MLWKTRICWKLESLILAQTKNSTGNPAPSKGKTAFIILAFSLVPVVLSPGVQSVLVFRTICVHIDTIP